MWVRETELRSFARTVQALNHWVTSQALRTYFYPHFPNNRRELEPWVMNVEPLLPDWVLGPSHELLYPAHISLYLLPLSSFYRCEVWSTDVQELLGRASQRHKTELRFSSGSGCFNSWAIDIMLLLTWEKCLPKNTQAVNTPTQLPMSGVRLCALFTPVSALRPPVFWYVWAYPSATGELDTRERKTMWHWLARWTQRRWWSPVCRGRSHWRCALP